MFRKQPKSISEVFQQVMRSQGLEQPLLQRRLMDSWNEIAGPVISRYTGEKAIKNQTLFVKITNPALRSELSMMRSDLVKRLNEQVGSFVISDIRIY